jgi:hypothetical protein
VPIHRRHRRRRTPPRQVRRLSPSPTTTPSPAPSGC